MISLSGFGFEEKLKEPVLVLNFRQPRLFLDMDFIDRDTFSKCSAKNSVDLCIDKYQINSLINIFKLN